MAVRAITREGRESLSILTAELKKGLPALEAELMARLDKRMEEAGESFSQALEEEKEAIKNLTPPTAKQVAALKGENTKLRKQVAAPVLPRQQPLAVAREVGGHNEACREKVVAHQREARRLLLPSRRRCIKCRLRHGRPAALVEGEGVRIAAGHLLPLAPAVGASPPPAAPAMRPAARRHLVRDCVQRETQERSCPD